MPKFIEFETIKGERIAVSIDKIIATTPIRAPDDDGVIIMYGEREDCCAVVKGKFDDVMSKITGLVSETD